MTIHRVARDFQYQKNVVLGNHSRTKESKFPWHASASESLELDLFIDTDKMLRYSEAFSFHPTNELPMQLLKEDVLEFTGGLNLEVLITPAIIRSDESLKSLKPSERSCYFEGERKLRFFQIYTKQNCQVECFSNFSLQTCKCVPFDTVRSPDTKICGLETEEIYCYSDLKSVFIDARTTKFQASCSCLSPCNSVTYSFEIREAKLKGYE